MTFRLVCLALTSCRATASHAGPHEVEDVLRLVTRSSPQKRDQPKNICVGGQSSYGQPALKAFSYKTNEIKPREE